MIPAAWLALIAFSFLALPAPARAENKYCDYTPAALEKKIDRKVRALTTALKLSPEQQLEIRALYEEKCAAAMHVGHDCALHQADLNEGIRALLTEAQRPAYEGVALTLKGKNGRKACCP